MGWYWKKKTEPYVVKKERKREIERDCACVCVFESGEWKPQIPLSLFFSKKKPISIKIQISKFSAK